VAAIAGSLGAQVVQIDRKTMCGSYNREQGQSVLQMVSALAREHCLVLAPLKVAEQSNQIRAIPAFLESLNLAECIITIRCDRNSNRHCRPHFAKQADYVLALKANYPKLF
jgi:hypothetical protein